VNTHINEGKMIDDKLQQLYNNFLEFSDHMAGIHGTMEVAAVMMTQALSIYKSNMDEDEYNRMVDMISASRTQVKTFDKPVIQ
jgi:folate-dependent tRNA-U54 methylase TrmFO/GidA